MAEVHCQLVNYLSPRDAEDVLTLLKHYAADPMGGGEALSDYTEKHLIEKLHNFPGAFSILVYKGDKAVGLANCFMQFSTFRCQPLVNIHDFVIHQGARGKGLAKLLLEAVESEALARGCCKITLEVLEGNTAAKRAYQKFGFENYALRPEVGKALFWEKRLDAA